MKIKRLAVIEIRANGIFCDPKCHLEPPSGGFKGHCQIFGRDLNGAQDGKVFRTKMCLNGEERWNKTQIEQAELKKLQAKVEELRNRALIARSFVRDAPFTAPEHLGSLFNSLDEVVGKLVELTEPETSEETPFNDPIEF